LYLEKDQVHNTIPKQLITLMSQLILAFNGMPEKHPLIEA